MHYSQHNKRKRKWALDITDHIHSYRDVHTSSWIYINRYEYLRSTTEQFFHQHYLNHNYVHGLGVITVLSTNAFADFIARSMWRTTLTAMDYTIMYNTLSQLKHPHDVYCSIEHHKHFSVC